MIKFIYYTQDCISSAVGFFKVKFSLSHYPIFYTSHETYILKQELEKSFKSIYKFGLSVCLSVCLFVCLFVSNKRQNG